MTKITEKESKTVLDAGNAVKIQTAQRMRAEEQLNQMQRILNCLSQQREEQERTLAEMTEWMNAMKAGQFESAAQMAGRTHTIASVRDDVQITKLIPLTSEETWEDYLGSVAQYAELEHLDLNSDPYMSMMSKQQQEAFAQMVRDDFYERKVVLDQGDYVIAAFCGVVTGLVDILFVGGPGKSVLPISQGRTLESLTNEKIEQIVMKFSQFCWEKDEPLRNSIREKNIPKAIKDDLLKKAGIPTQQSKIKKPQTLQQCIQYIENKFGINYDARYAKDLKSSVKNGVEISVNSDNPLAEKLSTSNHHLRSPAHSFDLLGLVFSIIDQFTGKTTLFRDGKIISFLPAEGSKAAQFELRGNNFIEKIICAVVNWFGHCMSDVAGSNSSTEGGAGLPIPGFELFQFLGAYNPTAGAENIGSVTIADFTTKMFEKGYDFRFGITMSIPVVLNDALVRTCYAIRRYFYFHLPFEDCIPFNGGPFYKHQPELRRMLLVAHGVLCAFDATGAIVAGAKDCMISAALNLNYFAWIRLTQLGISEVRAIYRQNHIDLQLVITKTNEEWEQLYLDGKTWKPTGLLR